MTNKCNTICLSPPPCFLGCHLVNHKYNKSKTTALNRTPHYANAAFNQARLNTIPRNAHFLRHCPLSTFCGKGTRKGTPPWLSRGKTQIAMSVKTSSYVCDDIAMPLSFNLYFTSVLQTILYLQRTREPSHSPIHTRVELAINRGVTKYGSSLSQVWTIACGNVQPLVISREGLVWLSATRAYSRAILVKTSTIMDNFDINNPLHCLPGLCSASLLLLIPCTVHFHMSDNLV